MKTDGRGCRTDGWFVMLVSALLVVGAFPLHARQEADDPFAGVEEMIVTGTTGSALLQTEAVSVATFDESYLDALGATNLKDVAQFTPNLEIRSPFTASNPTLFIRGVGLRDFNANSSSSVAVFNDDVYMNSPAGQLAQFFDVEDVQIHRGPQGTLDARNASAGAIKVISRKPSGDFGASLKTTYGRFNEVSIEGALESPISDSLSFRLSGVFNIRDGFTLNRCADRGEWSTATFRDDRFLDLDAATFRACFNQDTVQPVSRGGQNWFAGIAGATGDTVLSRRGLRTARFAQTPPGIDKWVNNRDNWAARLIFAYEPAETVKIFFNIHGGQNRGQSRQFEAIGRRTLTDGSGLTGPTIDNDSYFDGDRVIGVNRTPILDGDPTHGDPFAGDYNNTGLERLDLLGANLIANIEWGDLSIRSISAWEYNSRAVDADLDGSPSIGIEVDYGNRAWQLSQKIHLDWDDGGRFSAQGGVFYLHERLTVNNTFRLARQAAVLQNYEQVTDTGAIYFQGDYELSEVFEIEAGIRWNFERKDVSIVSGPSPQQPPPFGISPDFRGGAQNDVFENAVTGNIAFNYEPIPDILFYLKFTRGWKGPHINGGVIGTTGAGGEDLLDPARPEEVLSAEAGWKTTFWDSRVKFNGAGFYYDYKNLQIFQLKNESGGIPVQTLLNANDADVFGVELDFDFVPLQGFVPEAFENLRIFGSFAWLESEYTDFKNFRINFVQSVQVPVLEDFSGNRLINSPEFSFAGYVQWMFGLGDFGQIGPRADVSFKDRVFFNQNNFEELSQDPLWLLNLRVDYIAPGGNVELAGWVRNLTDEAYVGDAINLTNFSGKILYAIGDPRTYGGTLTIRF